MEPIVKYLKPNTKNKGESEVNWILDLNLADPTEIKFNYPS
jgi:hypothetical protein